jgi:tetratricopeptide (TPR) repeat protein
MEVVLVLPRSFSRPVRAGDPWVYRLCGRLTSSQSPTLILSTPSIGVRRFVEAATSLDCPLVWVDLSTEKHVDAVALGNRFVDAINRATGAYILPSGATFLRSVAAFRRLAGLLGPFVIAVAGAERFPEVVHEVLPLHHGGSRVVVISNDPGLVESFDSLSVISGGDLRMTRQEAASLVDGRLEDAEIESLLNDCEGDYARVNDALRARLGLPQYWSAANDDVVAESAEEFGLDANTFVEALVRRKRYIEAFELMCARAQHMVPRFIDQCGEAYFERGLFDRFWHHMYRLEVKTIENEGVMRWYFSAAMAVNRHDDLIPMIEAYLDKWEAPELRAQYAASRPSRQFLEETTRAVRSLESPVTLRHHAFALSLVGRHQEACEVLQRGLRLSDVLGRDQLVVAMGTDMCIALQRAGAFRDSVWWGEWACQEYSRRGLREEYRRVSGVAALAFSKMLVGDEVGLKDLVEDVGISSGMIGVPSYEGVVSTVADFFSVSGEVEKAVELYSLVFEAAPFDLAGLIAVDYVRCLVEFGDKVRAVEVGERAFAVSRSSSVYQQKCGSLARAIALKAAADPQAISALRSVVEAFGDGCDRVRLCQACIHLAEANLAAGDVDGARWAISQTNDQLLALGDTGWRLLGGSGPTLARVRAMTAATPSGLDLSLLGVPNATLHSEQVVLTQRQLEILLMLTQFPEGVSLEFLSGLLYGERAVPSTTKAAVSRLRSTVPLTSRPYRIGVPVRADFLELLEHLRHGRVRQAVSLYRGPLLRESDVPAIVSLREQIDESLRAAVLASGDASAMLELANRTDGDDLQLLEEAFRHLPARDPQSPLVRARIRQVRRDWGVESRSTDGDSL